MQFSNGSVHCNFIYLSSNASNDDYYLFYIIKVIKVINKILSMLLNIFEFNKDG